jgi:glucokinase
LEGDKICLSALKTVGFNLGILVSGVINLMNPEIDVLGGALNHTSSILVLIVRDVGSSYSLKLSQQDLKIVESKHGTEASVVGAPALVLDSIWREPGFSS